MRELSWKSSNFASWFWKESPVKVRLAAINWERFRKPKAESSFLNYAEVRKGARSEPGVNPRLSRSSELRYGS